MSKQNSHWWGIQMHPWRAPSQFQIAWFCIYWGIQGHIKWYSFTLKISVPYIVLNTLVFYFDKWYVAQCWMLYASVPKLYLHVHVCRDIIILNSENLSGRNAQHRCGVLINRSNEGSNQKQQREASSSALKTSTIVWLILANN